MRRARPPAWLSIVVVLLAAAHVRAAEVDAARSDARFSLVTRWGEAVGGRFPVLEGRLSRLPDGRGQVRVSLSASDVEIDGSPRNTRLARGRGFFDADRHPWVSFESDPFDPLLLHTGGALPGVLHIRDTRRRETFTVAPSGCARPAVDCPVVATGAVERARYGMNRWSFAVGGIVGFHLRIRVGGEEE